MCLIIVGPGDIKAVIAAPEEFLCVRTVSFPAVARQSSHQRRKVMEHHAGEFSWSRPGFRHFHQRPQSPFIHKASPDCKGPWDVLSCLDVCPGGRTEMIGPELANLCRTWHMPSAFVLSCLWSCFSLISLTYFKLGLRRFPLPTSRPLYLLFFCFESFSWVTLGLYSIGTSSQRRVLKIPSWANSSPIKTHTNTHPNFSSL